MNRLAAGCLVVALVVAACGDDDGRDAQPPAASSTTTTTTTTTASPASTTTTTTTVAVATQPFETEILTATYVDESRVTPATTQTEEQPSRTLDVWIDRPVVDGRRPLVIFAHGLGGHPRNHGMLRAHLAGEGFVVVSPAFPLTNTDVPGAFFNAGDTDAQVKDISFLIDAVRVDPDIGPLLDDGPVGMIGHSLGGLTTAGAAINESTRDDRIGAAVVMSAGFAGDVTDAIPVMVLHGDEDGTMPFAVGAAAYGTLTAERLLVTLVGGDHIEGILDDATDYGEAVRGFAAAFLAHSLGVDDGQVAALDGLVLDRVTVEAAGPTGELDDWRDYFA